MKIFLAFGVGLALGVCACASRSPALPSREGDGLENASITAAEAGANLEDARERASALTVTQVGFKESPGIDLAVRVGVLPARGASTRGDVLYFHGLGDRLDNHMPLFEEWARRGLRVVAFDLPGHGETEGLGNRLELFDFARLTRVALAVERATREDPNRPLFLSGTSVGALIAIRLAQNSAGDPANGFPRVDRHVSGATFFSPALAMFPLMGEQGRISARTLTSNLRPPHVAPPKPLSPFEAPGGLAFAGSLAAASKSAFNAGWPREIPLQVIVAGAADRYVRSKEVLRWLDVVRREAPGQPTQAYQCVDAFHELDNEPSPVGDFAREATATFLETLSQGRILRGSSATDTCAAL